MYYNTVYSTRVMDSLAAGNDQHIMPLAYIMSVMDVATYLNWYDKSSCWSDYVINKKI